MMADNLMKRFMLVVALLCGACRTVCPPCPPSEPRVRLVEVNVPVPIPCHVPIIPPPKPQIDGARSGDIRGILEAVLADLIAWRHAYTAQVAAARACAEPSAPP